MKSLNEFKEVKPIVEEEASDYSKFDMLVRAGLANKAQVQRIHRILDKMQDERPVFNNADRMILQNLFNKMVDLISNNKQIFQKARQAVREDVEEDLEEGIITTSDLKYNPKTGRKYPAHRKMMGKGKEKESLDEGISDVPFILVLKRKAIRMYPDGAKVALYYNEKLNKYFSVPYSLDKNVDSAIQAEELEAPNTLDFVRYIAESSSSNHVVFNDGHTYYVDAESAKAIVTLHESLDDVNKNILEEQLSIDKSHFKKIAQFAREHLV